MKTLSPGGRLVLTSLRALGLAMLVLGLAYTVVVLAVGQVAFPHQANSSLAVDTQGTVVGSTLIGQAYLTADDEPDPRFFQGRPSAVDYDGSRSAGSNAGPENPDLIASIEQRRAQVAAFNDVPSEHVPADALTASASGLDPHISPAYALLQVDRVASARGLGAAAVRALVESTIEGRDLGFLGEPRVNVVELNLALDAMEADG